MATSKQMPHRAANRLARYVLAMVLLAGCSSAGGVERTEPTTTLATSDATSPVTTAAAPPTTAEPTTTTTAIELPPRPAWLGTRDLLLPDGSIATGLD
ncbi:MAG: hypothetical protein R2710_18150, partial [Acidimicrobiales bacterium]